MPEEVQLYLQKLTDFSTQVRAGMTFYEGKLIDVPIVLVQCGVGKIHAALCTQLCLDHFGTQQVLFSGVAGALAEDLEIGDLIVSSQTMQHDMDVTALGFAPGQIPWTNMQLFDCCPKLQAMCLDTAHEMNFRARTGLVLSGDQFVADAIRVKFLREELKGDCVEMEAGAVGQVCELNGKIPFITLRAISDKADHSSPVDFPSFCQAAADRSAQIVLQMLSKYQTEFC